MKTQKLQPVITKNAVSDELQKITQLILQKVSVEKIICFGGSVKSITKNSCFTTQASPLNTEEQSSYCILLVPSAEEEIPDTLIQQRSEEAVKKIAAITVIVHRMEEINLALQNGSSFFTTIYKKGTLLHDSGKELFGVPAIETDLKQRVIRREKFWKQWSELSADFLEGAKFYSAVQKNNLSVFMLHQSLQHCYIATLRVFTGYRVNSNSLARILKIIENTLPDHAFLNTAHTPEEARLTSILLKGYNDARYSQKFEVTTEEVTNLIIRIEDILKYADTVCKLRINDIKEGKIPYIA